LKNKDNEIQKLNEEIESLKKEIEKLAAQKEEKTEEKEASVQEWALGKEKLYRSMKRSGLQEDLIKSRLGNTISFDMEGKNKNLEHTEIETKEEKAKRKNNGSELAYMRLLLEKLEERRKSIAGTEAIYENIEVKEKEVSFLDQIKSKRR